MLSDVILIYVDAMNFVDAADMLPPSLRDKYSKAWVELRGDPAQGPRGLYDRLDASLASDEPRLAAHGLSATRTPKQFEFKLVVLYRAYRRWRRAVAAQSSYDRMKKLLKRLLSVLDTILKSIIDALNLGGALEELKEIVEKTLGEDGGVLDDEADDEGDQELSKKERDTLVKQL